MVVAVVCCAALCPAHAHGDAGTVADHLASEPVAAEAALELAREAFDACVLRRERIAVPDGLPALLSERSGVFVSAILGDAPRCCMGSLHPIRPTLAGEIVDAACAAAGMDTRFPPVTPVDLPRLRLVVSVVDPPEPIASANALDPLHDGLAVRGSGRWGVVLPAETPHAALMETWARIRAGASPDEPVSFYRVSAFRIIQRDAP